MNNKINRIFLILAGVVFLSFVALSACVQEEAECTEDNQCPPGFVCATGGGVFSTGGICVREESDSSTSEQSENDADDE